MTRQEWLAGAAAEFIDLEVVPFTRPGSRLLVRADAQGVLRVERARYEVAAPETVVVAALEVLDAEGAPLPVSRVAVDRIEFGGAASLAFASAVALSIGGELSAVRITRPDGSASTLPLPQGMAALLHLDDRAGLEAVTQTEHLGHLGARSREWLDWFARCPLVECGLASIVAHCWWVLGANTLELASAPGSRVVVPSKLGYLGLWQWDAYFIAIGLRHGDRALAAEQLRLALSRPTPEGQLPDVLHDAGVLASSDDLPPADLARLRALGSPAADPAVPVPLTKPPLAALALCRLAESGLAPSALSDLLPVVRRSQEWWLTTAVGADGLPEYAHPYSSGLDDSPVFDQDLPVATPDLAAYLVLQDRVLADLLEGLGRRRDAASHRERANATRARLLRLWDPASGRFRSRGATGPVDAHAIVDLLPLLVGDLPADITAALLAELDDPARFDAPFAVPTVARDDPAFAPGRMWRGPAWVSTNWLLVEGLRRSGQGARARRLARDTVELVRRAGGAFEYFDPISGRPPAGAVPIFSWTAALVVDLAVSLATLDPSDT